MSERVVFHGWLDDINPVLMSMDAVVIPSRAEGFSFTAIEAFRARVPVISLDTGALPFTLQAGRNGFLCGDMDEMAGIVRREILAGGDEAARRVGQATEFLHAECSLETMVSRYLALWE